MVSRFLVAVALAVVVPAPQLALAAPPAAAAAPARPAAALTEAEAVRLALAQPALAAAVEGDVQTELGAGRAQAAWDNPELAYTHRRTRGPVGTTEQTLTVAQSFDLGGARARRSAAAAHRARAARAEGEAHRAGLALEVRRRFHAALHAQERLTALQAWTAAVERAHGIVARRQARGDATPWELRRLDREDHAARARLARAAAELGEAQARLEALWGGAPAVGRLAGSTLPANDPPAAGPSGGREANGPALRALDLRARAAAEERRAARRGWMPRVRVEGGWAGVDAGPAGRADGFEAGIGLSLPLWDAGSGAADAAAGEERALTARRALAATGRGAALEGARRSALGLRHAALALERDTAATGAALLQSAEAGFEGGELSLLELLDAYRGALDDQLELLSLRHAAREARLAFDHLAAGGLP